jgi:hypothetical protein
MDDRDQTFFSKIDSWFVLVTTAAVGWIWLSLARRLWAGRTVDVLDVCFPLFLSVFLVWVFRTTYYVVTADTLVVHAGPIRKRVLLTSVHRLRATHSPLSAPALSLDRIEVTYDTGKSILSSPRDKQGFIKAVLRRAPLVLLEGLSGA